MLSSMAGLYVFGQSVDLLFRRYSARPYKIADILLMTPQGCAIITKVVHPKSDERSPKNCSNGIKEIAMQQPKPGRAWYFVDESGDPTFYDKRGNLIVGKEGCSTILILGFIKTPNPEPIRSALQTLQRELLSDPYFQGVPSLQKPSYIFHAKNDIPEVRYRVYQLLADLEFTAYLVVARKIEQLFQIHSESSQSVFYDNVVSCLFRDVLHLHEENHIYFSKRQSKSRQAPLTEAVEKGRKTFYARSRGRVKTTYTVQAQTPLGEPCLSVIDYVNWAVQRAYSHGEMRYFNAISRKVRVVWDMYDPEKGRNNWYTRTKNPFHTNKVTPLQLGPSEGHTAWSRLSLAEE